MATLPKASHRASPVTVASVIPTSAKPRPMSAPTSSSSTTGSSGLLVVRMKRHQLLRPRTFSTSRAAVRSDVPSRTIAMPSTTNAQIGESSSCGLMSFSTPS